MLSQTLPALSELKANEVDKFSKTSKVVVVGHFDSKTSAEFKTFQKLAEAERDDFLFGYTINPKLKKKDVASSETDAPHIVLYKAFDEGKNILSVDLEDNEAILTFLKTNSVPLMDEIGPDNYSSYVELGVPIAFFFYSSPEERKLGSVFDSIAKKHKGVVSFAYIDAVKFGGHAKSLNVKEDWPALGIQNPTTQAKFPYDKSLGFTEKALSKFFQDFVDGKLVSSQKSEPVPEDNSGPVKIIVGKNFNEIALDKKHDVFVEIYAPWCGHCKKLAPIWDELGLHLKSSKIVLAKMDATENDLPPDVGFTVEGFPTLKLFKANSNEVVDYGGDRSFADLQKFLKENAVHADSFEVTELGAKEPEAEAEEDEEENDEL